MTTRTRNSSGRIAFVGSGPGDPGLLTVRARELLARAELVVTDPDVPAGVLELAGTGVEGEPEVRPAVGDPADVAKDLVTEAKAGRVVIRLVSGDPLTHSALVAEAQAVARTSAAFDVVPGVPAATAVPAYAGIALGATHAEVDVRGEVDWAGLAATPGPIVLLASSSHLAEAASALVEHGLAAQTPVAVTADGTGSGQRTLDTTLASLAADAGEIAGNLVVTVGQAVSGRTKLSWWESRALYGWRVLVPRTKDQAGEMSERLRLHGAIPSEVPTISVEPPRSPAQMERSVKGLVDG
ncbi:MAG TPA: SAM-dependent methyltransferase, partial [Actinophytocola sp.]|nr:SAM-dependent methyltransferase [Actinophytocola sp.]